MEIYFKTDKSIIKMKDRIDIEGKYITTSSIDQKEKAILEKYTSEKEAKEIFDNIIEIIDRCFKKDFKNILIDI